jgi:hypothetical protein
MFSFYAPTERVAVELTEEQLCIWGCWVYEPLVSPVLLEARSDVLRSNHFRCCFNSDALNTENGGVVISPSAHLPLSV